MTGVGITFLGRTARALGLVLLATLGTIAFTRLAPGYFTDTRELDAQYSSVAREQLAAQHQHEASLVATIAAQLGHWAHGDLGKSRHFDVPVSMLLRERTFATAKILATGIFAGWLLALMLALPLSARRGLRGETLIAFPVALLLSVPVGALATTCLLLNTGGPIVVLTLLITTRDFKFIYRLIRHVARAPQVLFARAQGLSSMQIVRAQIVPSLGPELLALAVTSFTVALSIAVPVEVIFDVPGLGQLAWNAAMNRDLPVLLAVTVIMATVVAVAMLFAQPSPTQEAACA